MVPGVRRPGGGLQALVSARCGVRGTRVASARNAAAARAPRSRGFAVFSDFMLCLPCHAAVQHRGTASADGQEVEHPQHVRDRPRRPRCDLDLLLALRRRSSLGCAQGLQTTALACNNNGAAVECSVRSGGAVATSATIFGRRRLGSCGLFGKAWPSCAVVEASLASSKKIHCFAGRRFC